MHPFIPFLTEEIWLKNKFDNLNKDFLMLSANWPILKKFLKKIKITKK